MGSLKLKIFFRKLSRKTYLPFFIVLLSSTLLISIFTYNDSYFKNNFINYENLFKDEIIKTRSFYKDIENKVNNLRKLRANEIISNDEKVKLQQKWLKPIEPIEISINVENLSRINEDLSHIRIEGTISAVWNPDKSFNSIISNNYGKLTKIAQEDFLKDAYLNFTSTEEQKFIQEGVVQNSNGFKKSTYRFEGNFPLLRDLRKFPFDNAIWQVKLSHPLNAATYIPITNSEEKKDIPSFVNAYQLKKVFCIDKSRNYYCNNISINNINDITKSKANISIYGSLTRSYSASFHRFILPIVFGIIVLALVDQVITKDKWDIKLTTPPTILLTFIFLQTGYHSQLEQISYLTYLDQIYLIGYLSCILMLINAIISKGDWFKKKSNRIKRIKYTRNIRIVFLLINILLPFILLLIL